MRKNRLSWYKQTRLIELFVAGSTARTAAHLVAVNKTTTIYYYYFQFLATGKNLFNSSSATFKP